MKEDKNVNLLLYLILVIALFAYEVHLYTFYSYIQIILFSLLFLVMLLLMKNKAYKIEFLRNLKKNFSIFWLFSLMILSTLMALLFFDYASISTIAIVILYILNTITIFLALPIYFRNNPKFATRFIRLYTALIVPIIIFGIILYFRDGLFGYYLEGNRSGSIYFDSNFFAIISAIPCALIFKQKIFSKPVSIFLAITSLSGILVSGSRGTMLSLVICMVYYIFIKFPNKKIIKKILLMSIIIIASIFFFKNLENISFLRLDQGSHGRSEMIVFALKELKKSPLFGYGFNAISTMLKNGGFSNSNTHNSLVDFAFRYGYPATFLYILLLFKAFIKSNTNKDKIYINLLLILLYVNMNTILYSFGGVGFPSMALTLCMGLACYEEEKNEKTFKHYNSSV